MYSLSGSLTTIRGNGYLQISGNLQRLRIGWYLYPNVDLQFGFFQGIEFKSEIEIRNRMKYVWMLMLWMDAYAMLNFDQFHINEKG